MRAFDKHNIILFNEFSKFSDEATRINYNILFISHTKIKVRKIFFH
jgi:hypothetical protein